MDIYAGHIICIYEEEISQHVCIGEYIYACMCVYMFVVYIECLHTYICYICYQCMSLHKCMHRVVACFGI